MSDFYDLSTSFYSQFVCTSVQYATEGRRVNRLNFSFKKIENLLAILHIDTSQKKAHQALWLGILINKLLRVDE